MTKMPPGGTPIHDRIQAEMLDSFDEELELEIDDDRLDPISRIRLTIEAVEAIVKARRVAEDRNDHGDEGRRAHAQSGDRLRRVTFGSGRPSPEQHRDTIARVPRAPGRSCSSDERVGAAQAPPGVRG